MADVTKLDYYEVLGVERTANDQVLKTAYRRLALQYHPDRNPDNPDAEERFKVCSEAYQVLSDPQKRAAYDRYGHAGVSGAGQGASGFGGSPFSGGFEDLGDIFGDLFGFNMGGRGGRGSSPRQKGSDVHFELTLEFEEAVFGKETEVNVHRREACTDCSGSGAAFGHGPTTCPQCKGHGQVRYQQGFFSVARTCNACGGSGRVISDPCPTCKGDGRIDRQRNIAVNVPAGVEDGTRIRYQGEGDAGRFGGPSGDLYVVLSVKAHKVFERDGNNLHCALPVSFPQAALGTEIELETLDGTVRLKIPEGTQSGKEFRLRSQGVPHLNAHGRGDLIVQIIVQTPAKLSKVQKELMRQLGDSLTVENVPTSHSSLFDKVKEIFS